MSTISRPSILIALTELGEVTEYTGGVGRRYASMFPHLQSAESFSVSLLLVCDTALSVQKSSLPENITAITFLTRVPWRLRTLVRPFILSWYVWRRRPTVVYSPEWLGQAAFLTKKTTLVTNLVTGLALIRDSSGVGSKINTRSRLVRIADRVQISLEDRQIRRSDGIVGCSSAVIEWNRSRFERALPDRVDLVPNCIDVESVRHFVDSIGDQRVSKPKSPGRLVLFVGRLERRKGVDVAISAFLRMSKKRDDCYFAFAGGEGDLQTEPSILTLANQLTDSVASRFTFLGNLDSERLYEYMQMAAVCVAPSRWEAFGNIALEVKAIGTPLVASKGSGFEDFCSDRVDSLLVPPGDSEALQVACEEILDNPTLAASLSAEGSRSVEKFTAYSVTERLINVLETYV